MKNSIYFLFTLVFLFVSCSQEEEMVDTTLTLTSEADSALKKAKTGKVDVCHYDADTDTWKTLNINGNALEAHLNHGDVSLVDADGDGYVEAVNECVPGGDCDDTNADINPGVDEIPYNGLDDDCDPATLDDDLDEDGFLNADDCDDNDAAINPDAEEICNNGIDDNCNGETDEDCVIQIGDFYQGGIVFDTDGTHGKIAAPSDLGYFLFGCEYQRWDDSCGEQPAIDACAELELNGYSDWYLPNHDELREVFRKRDIIDATAILHGGEKFNQNEAYWDSDGWYRYFFTGWSNKNYLDDYYTVRPIRAF
jgi:hypothetical protein